MNILDDLKMHVSYCWFLIASQSGRKLLLRICKFVFKVLSGCPTNIALSRPFVDT